MRRRRVLWHQKTFVVSMPLNEASFQRSEHRVSSKKQTSGYIFVSHASFIYILELFTCVVFICIVVYVIWVVVAFRRNYLSAKLKLLKKRDKFHRDLFTVVTLILHSRQLHQKKCSQLYSCGRIKSTTQNTIERHWCQLYNVCS